MHRAITDIKTEDLDTENYVTCGICKNISNTSDCIPLFNSLTEVNKLDLINYLSIELVSVVPRQKCVFF